MRSHAVGDLSGLGVPLTLAWGEHDGLVHPPAPGTLPEEVVQVALGGCGHVPTWDDPELVARVILDGTARSAGSARGEGPLTARA
jgi:pimeloyl-ACP methyl ester carboxylesterase